jgi:hypothetical protein
MRKIFALIIINVFLAVMTLSQVQAADWKTYNDPQGRFCSETFPKMEN